MPARLLCLIGQLGRGGTEKQLYLFLKNLDRNRWTPSVLTSNDLGLAETWGPRIRELGVEITSLGAWSSPLKPLAFRRAKRRSRPDLILSWSSYTNPFVLFSGRTPFLGAFRGGVDEERAGQGPLRFRLALAPRRIVVNSTRLKAELAAVGVPEARIEIMFNMIELRSDAERNDDAARTALREELGVPPEALVVCGAGRDSTYKEFPFWLDVFELASRQEPRLHALLVGRGPPIMIGDEIKRRGLSAKMTLTGEVPSAARVLGAGDVFFLSSSAEGMPNLLLEGIDAGCAAMATLAPGVGDVSSTWSDGTQVHALVRERDVDRTAQMLLALARDAPLRARVAGDQQRQLERFAPKAIAERWAELLASP